MVVLSSWIITLLQGPIVFSSRRINFSQIQRSEEDCWQQSRRLNGKVRNGTFFLIDSCRLIQWFFFKFFSSFTQKLWIIYDFLAKSLCQKVDRWRHNKFLKKIEGQTLASSTPSKFWDFLIFLFFWSFWITQYNTQKNYGVPTIVSCRGDQKMIYVCLRFSGSHHKFF